MVVDEITRRQCLLDMGSQVSLWPPSSSASRLPISSVQLTAANGPPIKSYGPCKRQIKIGGKSYHFVFLIAQVTRPILGLDFLQAFQMTLDLCNRRLIHSGQFTRFTTASSAVSGVNVVQSSPFARILAEYPEITDTALASCSSRHGVECFINTTGPSYQDGTETFNP